jgi:hypothetical protein
MPCLRVNALLSRAGLPCTQKAVRIAPILMGTTEETYDNQFPQS